MVAINTPASVFSFVFLNSYLEEDRSTTIHILQCKKNIKYQLHLLSLTFYALVNFNIKKPEISALIIVTLCSALFKVFSTKHEITLQWLDGCIKPYLWMNHSDFKVTGVHLNLTL